MAIREDPNDPGRYMATDQLVLVANAKVPEREILARVNAVLEDKRAPLRLSFTPPPPPSSEGETSGNEGENDPSWDFGRAASPTMHTSVKALHDTGFAAMAEPPLVTPDDPLGSISIVSPEPTEMQPVTPEPSEVPLPVNPPEPIDISTIHIPTTWEVGGVVARSLSLYTRYPDDGRPNNRAFQREVIESVMVLDAAIADGPLSGAVIAVSPNWLMVTAPPEQTGFGGPGTEPVLVPASELVPDPASQGILKHEISFQGAPTSLMNTLVDKNLGDGVTIVILDTSPTKELFEAVAPGNHNPLMSTLRGKLHFHTHPLNETELKPSSKPLDYVHPTTHNYDMRSHGLFVAGLIHSIIPKADIHLVRVLDNHGVGTLTSIMRGLEIAYKLKEAKANDKPFLINCSLTMVFPYSEQANSEALPPWLKAREDIWNALAAEQEALKQALQDTNGKPRAAPPLVLPTTLPARMRYVMELAIRTTAQAGILMVAAAGNERNTQNSSSPLPMTQYPAAFDDVVGVGALQSEITVASGGKRTVKFASYSCSVDKPAQEGFAVLGGDKGASGLIGVWLDKEAEAAQNKCWRRWAGTSFAAPIITGALALLMASGKNQQDALDALYNGWTEVTDPPARIDTPQVVLAKQG